jgi:hypothetical protein
MKQFFLLFLSISVSYSTFAQTKMYINKTSGTDSVWLSDIKSINFKTYSVHAEYIISGGPKPDSVIYVDDSLKVFVNAILVAAVNQGGVCCPPVPAIHFFANTGDTLRLVALDANTCYSVNTLWLQKADGSCLTKLTDAIYGPNCGSEPWQTVFFDQIFILP